MTAIIAKILDIYPKYGAKELKIYIRRNTWSSFIITSFVALLLLSLFYFYFMNNRNSINNLVAPTQIKIEIFSLVESTPPVEMKMNVPKELVFKGGIKERAGNPVPVPDALITPDKSDFADISKIGVASSDGNKDGNSEGNLNTASFVSEPKLDVKGSVPSEPDSDEFVPYEKAPGIDYARLQSYVKYPELAIKSGIEGKVYLRVLIDRDGSVRKMFVEETESILLNDAAINAIKSYGKFLPAIQNGETIMVWVSIPISFKLK